MRTESACLAILLYRFDALPKQKGTSRSQWHLDRAERLCDAFDFYRALVPRSAISFEQLVLLSKGLCDPTCLRQQRCELCGGSMIIDPVASPCVSCDTCKSNKVTTPTSSTRRAESPPTPITHHLEARLDTAPQD
jgi:hypothetical protein